MAKIYLELISYKLTTPNSFGDRVNSLGGKMKKYTNADVGRASRSANDKAERVLREYRVNPAKASALQSKTLRIVPLGGQDGIGEKNMIVVEYENDAVILDCGFDLGVDLPGVNYAIPVVEYLEGIKHKIRAYIISHGHMDHIGALTHVVPNFPAPIYGSQFTIGMVATQFEKMKETGNAFQPELVTLNMDTHERARIGVFTAELVRVTHSIPESSAIVLDTPRGRIINTGDFRLDPEPLDAMPSDVRRLTELGEDGVLLLMSESTNTTRMGRTPTEHTLQKSFYDLASKSKGRLIVAMFSTNMNRIQMIIDAAHHSGRKVALDGRSMMVVAELAIHLGKLKIPKGTLVPLSSIETIPDDEVLVICTGGQGEPGAALSRMAVGKHRLINLNQRDAVVISSTPIPGNEQSYAKIGDLLSAMGVKQYRHPTHEIDGSGPLHVSGHAARDEHAEMIQLVQPMFFMPIYGGALNRQYHKEIALKQGVQDKNIVMARNGDVIEFGVSDTARFAGQVTAGTRLIDQTGAMVPEIVTRDRLQLNDTGFVIVVATINREGRLMASLDVLTRGYIAARDNAAILDGVRAEARKAIKNKGEVRSKTAIELLKRSIQSAASAYLMKEVGSLPIVIPVINVIGTTKIYQRPVEDSH